MKILVTGGTGFLGKHLALRLLNLGHDVTVVGRNETIGKELLSVGINFLQIDLADEEKIISAICGQDYVFHCGALSSPWGKYEQFYQANVIGTQNVIKGCKRGSIQRLIHVSTPSLYFYYDERLDVKETDPLPKKFVNHYAKTKFLAEQEIDAFFQEGYPVITIRPRAIFGPGDNAIIPRLIRANQKGMIPLIDQGQHLMDLTYVDNVVDALLLCMTSPESTLGEKYNITNGERVTFKEVIESLFAKLGQQVHWKQMAYKQAFTIASLLEAVSKTILFHKEPILTKYTVSVLSRSQTLNIEKAKRELQYEPRISVQEGINQFVEWWKKNED